MHRLSPSGLRSLVLVVTGLMAASAAKADALSAVQVLREGGCGGVVPLAHPLRHNMLLDRAAEQWATGRPLAAAAEGFGYRGESAAGVYLRGPDSSLLEQLRQTSCRTVTAQALHEMGAYRRGLDLWLVLTTADTIAAPAALSTGARAWTRPPLALEPQTAATPPGAPQIASSALSTLMAAAPGVANRALQLVNDARARGARCGRRSFGPAPPLMLSGTLGGVALGHASDMAQHDYFEHEDLAGQSPADRVRAAGYREKLVGENIAYGPATVEEAVQGWLDSPDHCENIMDPRFNTVGFAYAPGSVSRHGLYWVMDLAASL